MFLECDIKSGIKEIEQRLVRISSDVNFIALAGRSNSGKSHVYKSLFRVLGGKYTCDCIEMDMYYYPKERKTVDGFDIPESMELDLVLEHITDLKEGNLVPRLKYTYDLGIREIDKENPIIAPKKYIFIDGLFSLKEEFLNHYYLKIFVEADAKKRFNRRLKRDKSMRGISEETIRKRWVEAEAMAEFFVDPTKDLADIIIKN